MIKIKHNPNGDTRSAPKDITFEQFHEANISHISDVDTVMYALSQVLKMMGERHDWTKLEYEDLFYKNFLSTMNEGTDFVNDKWYQLHIEAERHHPFSLCHEDINLLDIIETIVDCVCAGKARTGKIRPLEFNDEILRKAVKNTVDLIDTITEVVYPEDSPVVEKEKAEEVTQDAVNTMNDFTVYNFYE